MGSSTKVLMKTQAQSKWLGSWATWRCWEAAAGAGPGQYSPGQVSGQGRSYEEQSVRDSVFWKESGA